MESIPARIEKYDFKTYLGGATGYNIKVHRRFECEQCNIIIEKEETKT
jgi:hypothetical protein